MKVFLSWSGKQSLLLAKELKEWLPRVFQSVEPFLSTNDIEAGQKWQDRLNTVLEDHDFGIVSLTRANVTAPYVMFESGALAKKLGESKLVPVLCGITETELSKNPLTQFQYVHLTEEGIWSLCTSINASLGEKSLKDDILKSTFEVWWPKLGGKIEGILVTSEGPKKKIDRDEAIEEILSIVRSLARRQAPDTNYLSSYSLSKAIVAELGKADVFDPVTGTIRQPKIYSNLSRSLDKLTEATALIKRVKANLPTSQVPDPKPEQKSENDVGNIENPSENGPPKKEPQG